MSQMPNEKHENPAGLDGFDFLEFSAPNVHDVETYFKKHGFYGGGKTSF